jgi:hypothetical protein
MELQFTDWVDYMANTDASGISSIVQAIFLGVVQ